MSPEPRRAWLAAVEGVLVVLGLAGVGLLAAHPLSSADTFWQIKLGEVIVRTGSIPRTDLFSAVHPEHPWVQFAWLWQVLAYSVVSRAGLWGLRVMQAVLMVCSVGAVYALMRRAGRRVPHAALVAACALGLFVDRFQARPDSLNLLLATLATPLVLQFRRTTPRSVVAFGLLALLWVNLHAGTSLLLGGVLCMVLLGVALNTALRCGRDVGPERTRLAARQGALLFGVWLVMLVLTPHALTAIKDFSSALRPIVHAREPEWSPSLVLLDYGTHPAVILTAFAPFIVAALYAFHLRRSYREHGRLGIDFAEVVPCVALLGLAGFVTRNLFGCLLPLCVVVLGAARAARWDRALLALAIVLAALVFDDSGRVAYGNFERAQVAFQQDLAPGAYPEHAARFMRQAGIRGNVLNFPRWGDYLIERLFPACRVFFDSRRDVTTEMMGLLTQLGRVDQRSVALDTAFQRFGIELVVYEAPLFPTYRPEDPWRLLFKAGSEEVYQHVRGPHANENIERATRQFAREGVMLSPESAPSSPRARTPTSDARVAAIVEAGSRSFLADPWQQLLLREQTRMLQSADLGSRQQARRTLGLLLFRAGAYQRAVEYLRALVASEPGDASARYHLAFALYALGDDDGAFELAKTAAAPLAALLNPTQRFRFERLRALAAQRAGLQPPPGTEAREANVPVSPRGP